METIVENIKGSNDWTEIYQIDENQMKEGPYVIKNKSDNIMEEGTYKNGVICGIVKKYYKSGKLYSVVPYMNGRKHGELVDYYENGKVWMIMHYNDGKVHGICEDYGEDGRLVSKSIYEDDTLISQEIFHTTPRFYI